jgi:hypothetical protein
MHLTTPLNRYSSRPASRQSVRTYEQDLTVASHASENGGDDYDDVVESRASSRPQSRSSSRNGRATPDLDSLTLADPTHANSLSMSRSSMAGYKSPDSFLSQRSVSTVHPQDMANEEALMNQASALPNLLQVTALIVAATIFKALSGSYYTACGSCSHHFPSDPADC